MVSIAAFQAVDPGSIPGPRIFHSIWHCVRVVKELVLKANGLCPREFKSRRCRFLDSSDSLVVMTSALHAEGREFNPRSEHSFAMDEKKNAVCGDRTHALTNMRLKHAP
jgi:hypothetical protein